MSLQDEMKKKLTNALIYNADHLAFELSKLAEVHYASECADHELVYTREARAKRERLLTEIEQVLPAEMPNETKLALIAGIVSSARAEP